jgi:cyclopropane fatty-acyl-phospholipid synthase-like methyltransferase
LTNFTNYWIGLLLGMVNVLRHRLVGYRRPRHFGPDEIARSVDYVFEVVDRWQADGNIDWSDKRVLEIGPGPDLGTGAVILDRGAASYRAVDAFDLMGMTGDEFYDAVATRLDTPVEKERLSFTQATFPRLPEVEGTYDLIVSNATLEHIEDISMLFRRLRQLMDDGGQMVHHIDAQTHMRWMRDRDPLNILRYDEHIYRRVLSFPGAPNRVRADEYVIAATEANFQTTAVVPGRLADPQYLDEVRQRLATAFRNRPDLSLLNFTLLATATPVVDA